MKLYSYVVASDSGFAPNPFWGYCTLATCKPAIRRKAEKGDWIIGASSTRNVGHGRLIHAMKITESPLSFDEYDTDRRFHKKKPKEHADLRYSRGDNIYYRDRKGAWKQRPSRHNPGIWKEIWVARGLLCQSSIGILDGMLQKSPIDSKTWSLPVGTTSVIFLRNWFRIS